LSNCCTSGEANFQFAEISNVYHVDEDITNLNVITSLVLHNYQMLNLLCLLGSKVGLLGSTRKLVGIIMNVNSTILYFTGDQFTKKKLNNTIVTH
jgi:hypothetical protein